MKSWLSIATIDIVFNNADSLRLMWWTFFLASSILSVDNKGQRALSIMQIVVVCRQLATITPWIFVALY